jgi:hypothetical protein
MNGPDPDWWHVAHQTHRAGRTVRTTGMYEAVWVPSLELYRGTDGHPTRVQLTAFDDVFPTQPHAKTAWRLIREETNDETTS